MVTACYQYGQTTFIEAVNLSGNLKVLCDLSIIELTAGTEPPQPVDLPTIHREDPCYMSKPGAATLIAGHCICNANGRSVMFKQVKVD